MLGIGRTAYTSLPKSNVLNLSFKYLNNRSTFKVLTSRSYTSEKIHEDDLGRSFVKIGNSVKEIKNSSAPEKIPRGYLSLYNGAMSESQIFLKHLRWLMQKDELKQDSFLIGSPPGAFRRNLALSYAELTKREVEYLCLTRDTTESDIKQRREIEASSVYYVNQCAVNAALNGRILIIEGIEKAERNLLPILNNLLENREMNLDDGHFLVAPQRYDKLLELAKQTNSDLSNLNLLRVHEDFRVIAIGLPVPKYKGNPLDPPLRSRFQAHLASLPSYEDYNKYLTSSFTRVNHHLIDNLCGFAYSFYANESNSLGLPDFPLENLDKVVKIMNSCHLVDKNNQKNQSVNYNETFLSTSKLLDKIYPFSLILKEEETNEKHYFELMKKFNLPVKAKEKAATQKNEVDYELVSVDKIENETNKKTINFKSLNCSKSKILSADVISGNRKNKPSEPDSFIMNDYHSSQLVDMILNHSAESDFCLIGAQGSGKTELIKQFSNLLDYNVQTVHLYKDMSARDLLQQRITLTNGDTKWHNSPIVDAAINGDLIVLDGIHRLNSDALMSLRRLIQDRELDLPDGSRLISHHKYQLLLKDLNQSNMKLNDKVLTIHPSFRIIATAEPPATKFSFKDKKDEKSQPDPQSQSQSKANSEWLNSETLNLFIYQQIEPLEIRYEHEVLSKKFKLNDQHQRLLSLIEKLKQGENEEAQLKHLSKLLSLRKLIRLSNKIEKYPSLDLRELIENACLYKFMPQLNKQILADFFGKNNLIASIGSERDGVSSIEEFNKTFREVKTPEEKLDLQELAKIPDTLFYDNKQHSKILTNLMRDFQLGEHLLLIGNQGTGKNKLVDKFLMLTNKSREYIQLHRDTTVHSLTVQPVIKSGVVYYEDSPLVKAVKNGHILVIDEADKAPLHVTGILKSLIESNEMVLSDARRIVPPGSNYTSDRFIEMHKNFRMIILANRPGFPFLGNDFFAILGDLLSCHPVDNPDPQSEIEMLRMYAPNVSENVLGKIVAAFGSLRQLFDQGLISYPYSTREIVNIVRHLEKFSDESLASVLTNVYDFDHFSDKSDLKNTFKEVMNKHGISLGESTLRVNLAPSVELPRLLPLEKLNIKRVADSSGFLNSLSDLTWSKMADLQENDINRYECERRESRSDSFTELKYIWSLPNKQQVITDVCCTKGSDGDLIYATGIKPLSLIRLDTKTNQVVEINIGDYFQSSWSSYFPQIKLVRTSHPNKILVFEEVTDKLFMIDFDSMEVLKLEQSTRESRKNILNTARKTINKYFIDQNQLFKLLPLDMPNTFFSYKYNSNQINFIDLNNNIELSLNLDDININGKEAQENTKLRVNHMAQISPDSVLISVFNSNLVKSADNLKPSDLVYLIFKFKNEKIDQESRSIQDFNDKFELHFVENQSILGFGDDLLLQNIELRNINESYSIPKTIQDLSSEDKSSPAKPPVILPSIYNHFVAIPKLNLSDDSKVDSYFSRRHTPLLYSSSKNNDNFKIKKLVPIVKLIINYDTNQVLTQLPKSALPKNLPDNQVINTGYSECLGYIELIDIEHKNIRYLEVPKFNSNSKNNSWQYVNVGNEAEFLVDISPTNSGNIFTVDFNGNICEWETSLMNLKRSLDDWQKLVLDQQSRELKIEMLKESPNKELREFKGPKHGKVDEKNEPHVGGNQWAGGSGGFDTAGLGGVGGPYRLDSGHQVFQVSDAMKQSVPENVRRAAREVAEKAFKERLREINMSNFEFDLYSKYLDKVKKSVQQLRNILDGLEAKSKERQWLKNQTQGDLDDRKLIEAILGEKNVYRRRGEDPNADNSLNMEKPKRLKLVVDASGSMYRFNGVDNRLERQLESILMVMEAFKGYENKIVYDIVGHSGDGYNINIVNSSKIPQNEAERLKILKTVLAHSQFCSSGDHTFEATKYAIQEIGKEDADDYFVIVLSDANFDRYGLSPRRYSQILLDTDPKVNVYCLFIGTLGDQAVQLKKSLPFGKAFVCMNTEEIPKIMQQIFQSAMLNQ